MIDANDDGMVKVHQKLVDNFILRTCLNCECFDPHGETCLQFRVKPPAKVLVFGCEKWLPDIPF